MDILLEGRRRLRRSRIHASTDADGTGTGGGAARRGHFGSEPGAKLFDPAILDFGLGGGGERTDSAVLCTAVTDDEYEVQRSA